MVFFCLKPKFIVHLSKLNLQKKNLVQKKTFDLKKLQYFIITKSIGLYINILSIFAPQKAKHLAYSLFSQPRKGRIKLEKLPKTLSQAVQETLQYKEHNFQTYTWTRGKSELSEANGNDEVILLVHGWESNASRWKKMLPYLKKLGKTIIAIDAPAHGLSSGKEFNVPLYTEFLEIAVQKYKPTYLIGHSIGGAACVYHQKIYPNSTISKMVLLGAPSDLRIIVQNYIAMLSLNNKVHQLMQNKFIEKFNININEFSGHEFAKNIPIKTLIAHDTHDNIVAVAEGKKFASGFKNVTYIETSELGHSLHNDELYLQITTFLEEA